MSWKLLLLLSCAACYAPDVPECTLACTADADCVNGQACTGDGYCAASPATQCVQREAMPDGASVGSGSGTGSGTGSGSGTTTVSVHVTVDGNGTVTASTGLMCTNDCTFQVDKAVPMTLTAMPSSTHQAFDSWSGACATQPALCHVTPNAAITIGAKFTGNGGGGDQQ
ncbi:MAG: hypothetical protein ABJE66_20540 [Deltaproteobacteria bacterium]